MIKFPEIATHFLQNSFEKLPCPDQFVGIISDIEQSNCFTCRIPASKRPQNLPCVLLILESPHKNEFGVSPGPAKGGTGKNIVKYLRQVPGLQDKGNFGLLLVNAVQFQCSLGRPTSEFRDAVFYKVWDSGGKADFMSRLEALYQDDDCIANCCTRGNAKKVADHLRIIVHGALIESLPHGTPILRRNHPSFWHVQANRTREWRYGRTELRTVSSL